MITRFGFYHIRSVRGLTRVIRRHARRLRHVMRNIHSLENEVKEDFKKGLEEEEFKTWEKMFDEYEKAESEEFFITEEEEKFIKNIGDEEKGEGSKLEKLKQKLGKDANFIYPALQNMQDIAEEYSKFLNVVRVDMKDLYLKRMDRFMKYRTLYGSRFLAWEIKHLTRNQKRDVKHDRNEIKKFNDLIDEIEKLVKKNEVTGLKEKCDELNKLSDNLKKTMVIEIKHAATLFHYVDILQMRLLRKVLEDIPSDLKKLGEAGFDEKLGSNLAEKERHLAEEMGKNIFHLYEMTRWLQRHD